MFTELKTRKNIVWWTILFLVVFLILAYTLLPPVRINDNGIESKITYFAYLRFLEEMDGQFYLTLDDASFIIESGIAEDQSLEGDIDSLAGIKKLPLSPRAEILILGTEGERERIKVQELSLWLMEPESQRQVFEVYTIDGVISRLVPLLLD